MATKEIITLLQPSANVFQVAYWLVVPTARQSFYAKAGAVSQWTGASTAENAAIANGSITEIVEAVTYPAGTNLATLGPIVQARWTFFQTQVTNYDPWVYYGTYYDGTSWVQAGA